MNEERCFWCNRVIKRPNYVSFIAWRKDMMIKVCVECYRPKFKIDNLFTRTSERVRRQQEKYASDFVQPHIYDKHSRKLKINPDFIKLYPQSVYLYANREQLKKEGYEKLAQKIDQELNIEKKKEILEEVKDE